MPSPPPSLLRRATLAAAGLSLLLCLLTFFSATPARSDGSGIVRYVLTELPGLGGHSIVNSVWTDPINGDSYAVGSTRDASGNERPALWHNQELILLNPSGASGRATALRMQDGQPIVVGFSNMLVGTRSEQRVFQWQNGVMTVLPSEGRGLCRPYDVNEDGTIIGVSQPEIGLNRATLWINGVLSDLAPDPYYTNVATATDGAVIAGIQHRISRNQDVAAVWQNGIRTDLGTLGGYTSWAHDVAVIEGAPHVVGEATLPFTTVAHAFVWQGGMMTDLGTLGGDTSKATSINRLGQIVGAARRSDVRQHAVLWDGTIPVDLNTVVLNGADVELYDATSVDANGVIAALGTVGPAFVTHAYLLRPVVLPDTPPHITAVTPGSGIQGQTLDVVIRGTGLTPTTQVDFGPGITVNHTTPSASQLGQPGNGELSLTANITLAGDARLGFHSVKVTNPDLQWDRAEGAFTVNQGPPALNTFFFDYGTTVKGGQKLRGMVTLTLPAPAPHGAKIRFSTSNRSFKAPKSLSITKGWMTLKHSFAYKTKKVRSTTSYTVTAAYGGVSRSVQVTLLP